MTVAGWRNTGHDNYDTLSNSKTLLCGRMEEHDPLVMPQVKIEINVAEELPTSWMSQELIQGECLWSVSVNRLTSGLVKNTEHYL